LKKLLKKKESAEREPREPEEKTNTGKQKSDRKKGIPGR